MESGVELEVLPGSELLVQGVELGTVAQAALEQEHDSGRGEVELERRCLCEGHVAAKGMGPDEGVARRHPHLPAQHLERRRLPRP